MGSGASSPLPREGLPDADLVAFCGKFEQLEAEWHRIIEACSDNEWPEKSELYRETVRRIETTVATTPAGVIAKARALYAYYDEDFPMQGDLMGGIFRSMLCDAMGVSA